MLSGNKTPFTGYFGSSGNPELAVVVKGEWEYKDSSLLEDMILHLLFVWFLFYFFFQLVGKAGLHSQAN